MKKTLAIVLALSMLLGSVGMAESTLAVYTQKLLDAVPTLEKSETLYFEDGLNITGMGVHFNSYPTEFDGCFYFPAIEKMTGAHVGIDWRVEDNYGTQVATTLASGNLPDIIQAGDYGISALVSEGAILPLDDYLDLMPNIVAAVGENRMADWREADGHIYTFPTIVNVPGSQTVQVRKDWLDALGLPLPQTWDDWMAVWRAIKANDCNGNGDPTDEIPLALEQGGSGERSMASLLNAFGIKASSDCQFCVLDDGTYTMVYEHPRYREFLETVQAMYAEGLIDQQFATRTQSELFTIMDTNLCGTTMTWAERAKLSTYANADAGDADALWESVAPITGPYGDQMTQERAAVTGLWSVTVAAEDKIEDIVKFFDWCFSPEGINLYNYGIEGVSYDWVDGKPVMYPEVVANGFVDYRAMGMQYEPFGGAWQTEAFMQGLFAGVAIEDLDPGAASFYNGLAVVNTGKFYAMPQTLETEEYTEYRAELITTGVCVLRDQCVAGQITVDEFFTKYEALKAQGLQDVIDAGTAAYAKLVGG